MNPSELHSIEALNQANASDHLSEREKHLVGLAVTLTRGCAYCSGGRVEKAPGLRNHAGDSRRHRGLDCRSQCRRRRADRPAGNRRQ